MEPAATVGQPAHPIIQQEQPLLAFGYFKPSIALRFTMIILPLCI